MGKQVSSHRVRTASLFSTIVLAGAASNSFFACSQSAGGSGGTTGSGGAVASGTGGASSPKGSGGQIGTGGATGTGGAGQGGTTAAGGGGAGATNGGGRSGSGGAPVAGGGMAGQGAGGRAGDTGSGGASGAGGAGGGAIDAARDDAGSALGGKGSGGATGAGGAKPGDASGAGGASAGGSSGGEATFVPDPGWACGMVDGIVPPTQGTLAFSVSLQIGSTHDVGNTPYGHRRLLDVKGGTITGDRLKGSVMTGGLEYELVLSNGVVELQGINIFKTSDNALIYVRSCGVAPDGASGPRVIPDFEAATSGSYAWLNTGKFVATRALDSAGGTLKLDVYDVSKVTAADPRVQISKPAGVPKQPWECNTTTGTKGTSVFTENVTLGSSISIANAKRGSRNIIPITGGTTTGKVAGAILNGGADYQLSGSLDAWYTLAPSNGELILVRNCGPMGKLIPWFEARTDGDYNFLNANTFISSDPGSGSGGVGITFYERK